jgi:hypothetical protein
VVTVEKEREQVQRAYSDWSKALRGDEYQFGAGAEVLEPSLVTFNEDFTIPAMTRLSSEARGGR